MSSDGSQYCATVISTAPAFSRQGTFVQHRLTSVFVPERHGVFNVPSSELSATIIQVTVIIFFYHN